jgi:hypothetical protein
MSTLTEDLEAAMNRLDTKAAARLESVVREVIELSAHSMSEKREQPDSNDWPIGYFENTAGSFANEPFDFPVDPPVEPIANW